MRVSVNLDDELVSPRCEVCDKRTDQNLAGEFSAAQPFSAQLAS